MREQLVPRSEHDREWNRAKDSLEKLERAVDLNTRTLVPRGEMLEKMAMQTSVDIALQKQIDDIRKMIVDRLERENERLRTK